MSRRRWTRRSARSSTRSSSVASPRAAFPRTTRHRRQERNWSYRWSIKISCECVHDGRQYDIVVRNGDTFVWSRGKKVSAGKLEGVPTTIDRFFEMAAWLDMKPGSKAAFDGALGYPMRLSVGPDPHVAGQSETIDVMSFGPLCDATEACGTPED